MADPPILLAEKLRGTGKGKRLKMIGIIGAGNMGGALIKGLGFDPKNKIIASDVSKDRLEFLKKNYRIQIANSNIALAEISDIIILAVKPKQIDDVLSQIKPVVGSVKLIISVAAGITTKRIEQKIKKEVAVIRAMPNMPALIGKGVSAISGGRFAEQKHIKIALDILSSVGRAIQVDEDKMDIITAVSGSGPAYFFFLIEILIDITVKHSLDKKTAEEFAVGTAFGAASLAYKTKETPALLRKKVTSKGGTTEAAFRVFENEGLAKIFKKAIKAAIKRSEELSCS